MAGHGKILTVTQTDSGRFAFLNAIAKSEYAFWAKRPVLSDSRPAVCVTAMADNMGRFAMTAKDGKPCEKCGTSEWGTRNRCKQCAANRHREWVKNNPERAREIARESYARHADERRAGDKKRRAENPEHYREIGRKSRERNIERVREYDRQRNRENPQRSREATLQWYRNNKDHHLEVGRKWRKENPEQACSIRARRKTRIAGGRGSYTAAEFKDLCAKYNNRCLACGRYDLKLTADHVIPVSKGGSSDIDNIQPLCASCNSSKGTKTTDYRQKPGLLRLIQRKLFDI